MTDRSIFATDLEHEYHTEIVRLMDELCAANAHIERLRGALTIVPGTVTEEERQWADNAGLKGAAQIAAKQVASTKNVRIRSDLVERLRELAKYDKSQLLAGEAAAEIERLRKALDTEKKWNATLEITARKDAEQARNAALEEAAKEAERWNSPARTERIAAAIRDLKEKS